MDYTQAREAFFQPRAAGAAPPGSTAWTSPARALRDAIEPIATICFWSEPAYDAYAAVGLNFLTGYVWGRASVLGEADPAVAAAGFGVFEPGLIANLYDAGRQACGLAQVRAAKEGGAVTALRQVLGDTDVTAAVEVLRAICAAADPTGRPLHAGLAALPWPADPLGQLWHVCSVLREYRGDGHLAACVAAGLTGLEANLLTEAYVGWDTLAYTGSRGWSPEAMQRASTGLAEQGLLLGGVLTDAGRSLRDGLELATDRSVSRAVSAAGPALADTVQQLQEWSGRIVEAGWFPPDPYKRASG